MTIQDKRDAQVSQDAQDSDYGPSPRQWVREQVEKFERTNGAEGGTMRGMPIVVLTMKGAKTGKIRKVPLMRVEQDGRYAAVASLGGAPTHPVWYYNIKANPRLLLQDGPNRFDMVAREVSGEERQRWWDLAVEAYPDYADYQLKTDREIPVFVLEPASD
ncbi:MAG TPA: nitroreductase family deazaflavin-dependent oxidoreductase [Actinomycetales bacterium]|nr:nitroreductase family deazaflavin-dependent oxidoreductase [Actinomycetales bacterium]